MNADKHEAQLDALNAGLAKSREEMAALASRLNALSQGLAAAEGEESKWSAIQHRIVAVGSRGKETAQDLVEEIERHPLIGGLPAFGVGFGIATLLFKRPLAGPRERE